MTISAVPPEWSGKVFDELRPQLLKALRTGQGDGITEIEFRRAVESGQMQMWAVHDDEGIKAAIVISVSQHSTGRKLFVELLLGHNIDDWVADLERLLQDYREITGAMCIESSCRPGLAKYLATRGWRKKAVIMEAPK